jgi:hypothetical protein
VTKGALRRRPSRRPGSVWRVSADVLARRLRALGVLSERVCRSVLRHVR